MIVMWLDPERDEDQEDKSANLVEHLKQYEVEVVTAYPDLMPMVIARCTKDQIKALKEDREIFVEKNRKVHVLEEVLDDGGVASGRPPNCS